MPDPKRASPSVSNADNISYAIAVPVADMEASPIQLCSWLLGDTPGWSFVVVRFVLGVLVQEDVDFAIVGNPDVVVDACSGRVAPIYTVA